MAGMKVQVGSLLGCVLFMVGCSKEKIAEVLPAEAPERVVSLEQIQATQDGLIRVKGEANPFTGRVVGRRPGGGKEQEMTFVEGARHGTYVKWHANGKKAEEVAWLRGVQEGPARAWLATGSRLYETTYREGRREGIYTEWHTNGRKRMEATFRNGQQEGPTTEWHRDGSVARREIWRGGKLVEELDAAELAAAANQIVAERERLDNTLWKDETRAQVYEETFVALWDTLRAAKDKWSPFEKFPLDSVHLPAKNRTSTHDWGIGATHYQGQASKLDRAGWRDWLNALQSTGIVVVETEWHQEAFHAEKPASTFNFVVHATGPREMRYIVRGKLRVGWTDRKDAKGHFEAGGVVVTEAVVFARKGTPPFRKIARMSPGEDQTPLGMPLLVYDLNRDGRSEVILAGANQVYWNEGDGQLRKRRLCAHYPSRLSAAVIADFDGDGVADLLGQPIDTAPILYRGGAGGRFEGEPEVIMNQPAEFAGGICATVGDIDGDGDLDAWLAQYKSAYKNGQMPTPYYDANDGFPSFLFINDGKGRFTESTAAAGLDKKRFRRTYSSSLVDLDGDHDLDLVVISDFAGLDIYLNDGKGRFTDVTDRLGNERYSFGMSHALADFNGDERVDLYMAGMGSTTARRLERLKLSRKEFPEHQKTRMLMGYGNRMLLGGPGGALKQAAYNDQVARTGWAWGCTPLDFDNDGDRDLYIANGHISGKSAKDHCTTFWRHDVFTGTSKYNRGLSKFFTESQACLDTISWNGFEHNVLLMNEASKSFLNVSFLMNTAHEFDSRAIVADDLDGDGRSDLLVVESVSQQGRSALEHLHILRNEWEMPGNWIGVTLHEHGPGQSPIGARITVTAGGRRQVMQVVTGDSFRAQHANQKHFGLGTVNQVESIEVRWPNGKVSRLDQPTVGHYHEVKP